MTVAIEVARDDLRTVRVVDAPPVAPTDGEARIDVRSFGLTANNITYAVFGEAMRYWDFFPAPDPGPDGDRHRWGRVPVWGFGEVAESRSPGLEPGTPVFGYFPMAGELLVRPGRLGGGGFTDTAAHRAALPSVYNRYTLVDDDPGFTAGHEAQDMLLRPLFVTSFVIDDFLGDHDLFGATTAVVSSASAKSAIGSAYLLGRRPGLEVVGLTSAANVAFVEGLGCYDRVVPYEAVDGLPVADAVYVDVAGRNDVTAAVHTRYGDRLRYSMVVGDTHWDDPSVRGGPLAGPRPQFLFAPDQIAKRQQDWGRDGYEAAVAAAWTEMVDFTDGWLQVRHADGPDEVEAVYRHLLDGAVDPRVGHVCTLGGPDG